ncbi:MAG TPA: WD40 repeat domain-containing protein [Aggregatilineaceae bacterium]|nr:WD40 repeat domain-containing protein [Aggregatilineaceae bacterium]
MCVKKLTVLFLFAFLFSSAFGPATAQDALTQTYDDGMLRFNYPEGWSAYVSYGGEVILVNNPALLESATPPQTGDIRISFTPPPLAAADWARLDISSANALAANAANVLISYDPNSEIVDSADVMIGNYQATVVHMTNPDKDMMVIGVDIGASNPMALNATTAPNEMSSFEPILLSIVESIQYTEPAYQSAFQLSVPFTMWPSAFDYTLSADGSLLAMMQVDPEQDGRQLTILNLDSKTEIIQTQIADEGPLMVFSPDNSMILIGTTGQGTLYDLNGNEKVRLERQRNGQNYAISPDGRLVASGTQQSKCIFLWDVETGASLPQVCNDAGGRPIVVGFTADQSTIITTTGLWDMETGEIEKFEGDFLGFLPDGSVITRDTAAPLVGEPLAVRADGQILGYREAHLVLYDPTTGTSETLFAIPPIYSKLTSNATGTSVVAFNDFGSTLDVYVWDIP